MTHVLSGKVTVATAGTAVALPANQKRVVALVIQNQADVSMFVGDSNVDSTTGYEIEAGSSAQDAETRLQWPIPPGESIKLDDVYVDAASGSSKVASFIATLQ